MGSISDFSVSKPEESKTEWVEPKPDSVEAPSPATTDEPSIAPAITQPVVDNTINEILAKIGDDITSGAKMKMLIYGEPGSMKSSFTATAANNLVLDLEDGLISAKHSPHGVAHNVRPYPWQGFEDFAKLIGVLQNNPPELDWIDVLSIDTFSDLHKRALAEVTEREWRKRPSSNRFVAETEHHVENNERMLRMIRALRDLNRDLLIVTHSKTVEPKGKPSKTYADFSESLSNRIMGMMDIVGYAEKKVIDDEVSMVVKFTGDGSIHCKTRIPLPDEMINPTFSDIKKVWEESKNK